MWHRRYLGEILQTAKDKFIFGWERKLHESEQVNCESDICNQIKTKCVIFIGNWAWKFLTSFVSRLCKLAFRDKTVSKWNKVCDEREAFVIDDRAVLQAKKIFKRNILELMTSSINDISSHQHEATYNFRRK